MRARRVSSGEPREASPTDGCGNHQGDKRLCKGTRRRGTAVRTQAVPTFQNSRRLLLLARQSRALGGGGSAERWGAGTEGRPVLGGVGALSKPRGLQGTETVETRRPEGPNRPGCYRSRTLLPPADGHPVASVSPSLKLGVLEEGGLAVPQGLGEDPQLDRPPEGRRRVHSLHGLNSAHHPDAL